MRTLHEILHEARTAAFDLHFTRAREWKASQSDRTLIGFLPIYFPREIVHAMNGLAIGIMGAGDRMQIVRGDAYYQSYICHMPRGVIEMALSNNLNDCDGFIFPSICDVIRNLSGMFQLLNKGRFTKYLDFPQNFNAETGGVFYRNELLHVISSIAACNNAVLDNERLNASIRLFNANRRLIEELYNIRQDFPWRLSFEELYNVIRAGLSMTVEEHNAMLEEVCVLARENGGEPMDKIRVVISGSFCEQPPLGLIKTIEMAGCYVVDDDLMLGSRWIQGDVDDSSDDALGALVDAYLQRSVFSSSVYDADNPKGGHLVELVRRRRADGVVFAAASFCDPALLDRPSLVQACDDAGIRHIGIQYHENTGQFKVIKEQVGGFSDSIKLWEGEEVMA